MDIQFRPITWPRQRPRTPSEERMSPAVFQVTYEQTLDELEYEAERADADSMVIEVDVSGADIRKDGRLRVRAEPDDPGVGVVFLGTPHGDLSWYSDAYGHWHANLRAIRLTVQALRGVDRWGAGSGLQYAGYRQLPPPSGKPTTSEEAAQVIAEYASSMNEAPRVDRILGDPEFARRACRSAKMVSHPDRGGDSATFDRVVKAAAVLGW